jgi:hypothetical protein
MAHKPDRRDGFSDVLASIGRRPRATNQNVTRHYSETLSKALAIWLRELLLKDSRVERVLSPEARVPTCFGRKSLDVGCLDVNGYLALDISIKTFSFRDRATGRYTHNFTGRFYELLGEGLDLRLSYPEAVLAALIFLPSDSCDDGTPNAASSFGNAVKQYAKIAGRGTDGEHALSFEHVFVALYDDDDGVRFFDARTPPPRRGKPPRDSVVTTRAMLDRILATVADRDSKRMPDSMNIQPVFRWADIEG